MFFWFDDHWYRQIRKKGLTSRSIYVAFEPPVVDMNHSPKGIDELKRFFPYILTWNDDLVDNQRVFKFMYPYWFDCDTINPVSFDKKKLLVNISGNKTSIVQDELYSERKRVIRYFDSNSSFELYGPGWDKEQFASYKGLAASKKEVYSSFRFALCLENMKNVKGYITEKILDCFCAGIVPIYQGASNVSDYIPDDCYIHYDSFHNLNELEDYLVSITEKEYNQFLKNTKSFLESEKINCFLPSSFVDAIISLFNKFPNTYFKPRWGSVKVTIRYVKFLGKRILSNIKTVAIEKTRSDLNNRVGD